MSNELEVLKAATATLQGAGIPYMVTGSMAANFYATPRMTRDIDLVVDLSAADIDRVVRLFQGTYYIDPDMVRQAIQNRSMFNMIHTALVARSTASFEKIATIDGKNLRAVGRSLLLVSRSLSWLRRI